MLFHKRENCLVVFDLRTGNAVKPRQIPESLRRFLRLYFARAVRVGNYQPAARVYIIGKRFYHGSAQICDVEKYYCIKTRIT